MAIRTFKTYDAALRAANGGPVLRIKAGRQSLYVTGFAPDDVVLDGVELIDPASGVAGQVTLRHLARLGNANHATAHPSWAGKEAV